MGTDRSRRHLAEDAECLVVVDVLSFTTSVTVCVSRGMAVLPDRWADADAGDFAAAHDAQLAVRRRDVSADHPWSLSPAVLSTAPVTPRLVLPSPNGSTIAAAAASGGTEGRRRLPAQRPAVGRWLVAHDYGTPDAPWSVVASGERWPDGSLRPALEDALGAGAVLHQLRAAGCMLVGRRPTAMAAMFEATRDVEAAVGLGLGPPAGQRRVRRRRRRGGPARLRRDGPGARRRSVHLVIGLTCSLNRTHKQAARHGLRASHGLLAGL